MLEGTLVVLTDAPIDIIGKFVLNLIAIALFAMFAARLRRRETQSES
jgi:hypothetical protein